jgi:hypothetical protein
VTVKSANLEDLHRTYFQRTGAARALKEILHHIEAGRLKKLSSVLRSHEYATISSESEIAFRDRVDDLLSYCGVLEIAVLARFIDEPGDSAFWLNLSRILGCLPVQRYYVEYYPQRLPNLLQARLTGRFAIFLPDDHRVLEAMMEFFRLDRRFHRLFDGGVLLPMLDGFTYDGVGLEDVAECIARPRRFLDALLAPRDDRDVTELAIQEFAAFVQFSFELKELLDRLDELPLLQSEIWHYFGYWYGHLRSEMRTGLRDALNEFTHWRAPARQREASRAVRTEVRRANLVIAALTSRTYGAAVNAAVRFSLK